MTEVTVLCLLRHGHATTATTIDSLYANTRLPFKLIYADVASPGVVAEYMQQLASRHQFVDHLRFGEFISRQNARIAALARVDTPYTVLVDNNILASDGWLEALLEAQLESGASLVSPLIVTQGGTIHFSAGRVVKGRRLRSLGLKTLLKPQFQPAAPTGENIADTSPVRTDIDFAESHFCFAVTEDLRLPGVMEESMHNAHTVCYAGYSLKNHYGKRLIIEPGAVASLVPIGFGYDLPWICQSYMRPDWIKSSYNRLEELMGKGLGTNAHQGARWHAKHLKYFLLSMLDGNNRDRQDLLAAAEIPSVIRGYDPPLPRNADRRIDRELMPWVRRKYPQLEGALNQWLGWRIPV
jgi:hypothetical protein